MNLDQRSARKVGFGAVLMIAGGLTMVFTPLLSINLFFVGIGIVLVGAFLVASVLFPT